MNYHNSSQKFLSILKVIVLALILAVGIQYIHAFTSAPVPAPTCPTGYPGCDAPLNVGSSAQTKLGSLTVNGSTTAQNAIGLYAWGQSVFNTGGVGTSAIQIIDGSQGVGKVLTSDANGNATWTAGGGNSVTTFDPTASTNIIWYRGNTLQTGTWPPGLVDNNVVGSTDCPSPNTSSEQEAISYPSTIPTDAYAIEVTGTVGSYANGASQAGLVYAQVSNVSGADYLPLATTEANTTASQYADAEWSINSGSVILPYNPSRVIYVNWAAADVNCGTFMFIRTNFAGYFE